jgi:hypothetical protein
VLPVLPMLPVPLPLLLLIVLLLLTLLVVVACGRRWYKRRLADGDDAIRGRRWWCHVDRGDADCACW